MCATCYTCVKLWIDSCTVMVFSFGQFVLVNFVFDFLTRHFCLCETGKDLLSFPLCILPFLRYEPERILHSSLITETNHMSFGQLWHLVIGCLLYRCLATLYLLSTCSLVSHHVPWWVLIAHGFVVHNNGIPWVDSSTFRRQQIFFSPHSVR